MLFILINLKKWLVSWFVSSLPGEILELYFPLIYTLWNAQVETMLNAKLQLRMEDWQGVEGCVFFFHRSDWKIDSSLLMDDDLVKPCDKGWSGKMLCLLLRLLLLRAQYIRTSEPALAPGPPKSISQYRTVCLSVFLSPSNPSFLPDFVSPYYYLKPPEICYLRFYCLSFLSL